MPFQFYCPNRHLLQANEDQIGQAVKCPICQVEILIPAPAGMTVPPPSPAPIPGPVPGMNPPAGMNPTAGAGPFQPNPQASGFSMDLNPSGKFNFLKPKGEGGGELEPDNEGNPDSEGNLGLADAENDDILHAVCPNNHILEIDRQMLGEKAVCPYCNSVFEIKLERTVEFMEKKKREEEFAANKLGNAWFQWSIAALVVALFFIVIMIGLMIGK